MAVGKVRAALASILQNNELFVDTERKANIQSDCLALLQIDSKEFEAFCEALEKDINEIFTAKSRLRLATRKRERFWCIFHQKRISTLPTLWKDFGTLSGVEVDAVVEQEINSSIFYSYFKKEMMPSGCCSNCYQDNRRKS